MAHSESSGLSYEGLGFDPSRFEIAVRRVLGPFYTVAATDRQTGAKVPLLASRSLGLYLGRGSVRRAVKYGIRRYRDAHPELFGSR